MILNIYHIFSGFIFFNPLFRDKKPETWDFFYQRKYHTALEIFGMSQLIL
jgi:hypothetical protein